MIVVEEIAALIGAKIDEGEFADVFALFDHVADYASKVVGLIEEGISKGFETIDKVAESGDYLGDLAARYGESAAAIQELGYVATLSGSSTDELTGSLKFLAKAASDAADGGKEAIKAFGGVKLKDAQGQIRPLEDLIMDLSDSFNSLPDDANKAARAMTLFGRDGAKLVQMLNRGSDGIAALRAEAVRSGAVLSEAAFAAAEIRDLVHQPRAGTHKRVEQGAVEAPDAGQDQAHAQSAKDDDAHNAR